MARVLAEPEPRAREDAIYGYSDAPNQNFAELFEGLQIVSICLGLTSCLTHEHMAGYASNTSKSPVEATGWRFCFRGI